MTATPTATATANVTATPQPVTVLGLGNLGQAIAAAFLDAGHPTTVWNRTRSRADALVARGARRAEDPAAAIAASELVVVAVLDSDTARAVLDPAADALKGRTLVNLTSSTPGPSGELAAWATDAGADYLAGAVYAVPQTLGTADAFVLYSGSAAAHERHRERLALLGRDVFVGTDPSLAAVHDVAVLSGMYGMFAGFFQAMALARSAAIPAADLTEHLVTWLKAAADALPGFAREIDSGDYSTDTSSLEMNAAGLDSILAATEAQGLPTDLIAPVRALLATQIAQGHGGLSLARAVESLPAPAAR
ncbi:NAD(P)-dependent oxidoreductase [Streptomyces yaizuensis]|uniref:NAD(P)-binding domain-containing protein n=1 Tax=Streptomyces yaizuensis TaxID=2989713 RepID=A0ABQ5NWX8_9ACTN|nr:NAD(P)-binding domain-containing protein [Streptomyces sp. YSPA8]GLF94875.1 NAD(P)-binding domain-containing protein [Streptomyces sp. YSPA8]